MTTDPVTVAELRAAWNRAGLALRFLGWTFAKAIDTPTVRWSLEKSALAARRTHNLPAQPRLL